MKNLNNGASKYQHGASTFRSLYKANIVYDNSSLLTHLIKPRGRLFGKYIGILINKRLYIQNVSLNAFFDHFDFLLCSGNYITNKGASVIKVRSLCHDL
jgi:hypothetical protein